MKQLNKKKRNMKGKYHQIIPSTDSRFHETCYIHIEEKLLNPETQPIVNSASTNLLKHLKEINPTFDFSELTKLRALTNPATPYYNNDRDNSKYDLILYVDDIIEGPKREDVEKWIEIEKEMKNESEKEIQMERKDSKQKDQKERNEQKEIHNSYINYLHFQNVSKCRKSGKKYKVIEMLGEGSFGQVVKCLDIETNQFVAMKVLRNKPVYIRQGMLELTMLELLNRYFDPNCEYHTLRLYDHFLYCDHICIVNELLSINLYELMSENNCEGLSVNISRTFLQQILESLDICYQKNIVHCDLKPENVLLVDMTRNVRLIDFGSACFENNTLYSYIQSRHYRAPEVILGMSYTTAIDMWSLGCIAAEFFLGIPIFPGSCEHNQLYKIIKMIGMPPTELLEKSKRTNKFFNKQKGMNGKFVYELKSEEEYEFDNRESIEPNRDYYDYVSLEDFCMRVPMKFSSKDEHRKEEIRRSFYDFLKRIFCWKAEDRMQPSQALRHPFITKKLFSGTVDIERSVSPVRRMKEKTMLIDEMISKIFDDLTSHETMQYINENLTTSEYYKTYFRAFDKGIILNIQNANPFLLPPMTPPSVIQLFEQIEHEKELQERKEQIEKREQNKFQKKSPIEIHHSQENKTFDESTMLSEKYHLENPNEISRKESNRISIQKDQSTSLDTSRFYSENNSESYRQSWSQTVDMKIPGSEDISFSFENDMNSFVSPNEMNQRKQTSLSQMTPIEEDEK